MSSESKALITIPGAPKPPPCEQCLYQNHTTIKDYLISRIFVILVQGRKNWKDLGDFWHYKKKGRETFNFKKKQRKEQQDTFSSMLHTEETILWTAL